jgi:hypothetical protein
MGREPCKVLTTRHLLNHLYFSTRRHPPDFECFPACRGFSINCSSGMPPTSAGVRQRSAIRVHFPAHSYNNGLTAWIERKGEPHFDPTICIPSRSISLFLAASRSAKCPLVAISYRLITQRSLVQIQPPQPIQPEILKIEFEIHLLLQKPHTTPR